MRTIRVARAVCAVWALAGGAALHAQDAGDAALDVTIRLLPENARGPEDVTRRIELPPAGELARQRPAAAEEARAAPRDDNGRGDEVSREARERGREFGQEVSEQARENRENAGRNENAARPNEGGRPGDAGRPDTPGRPDNPGRPDDTGRPDDAGRPDNPGRPDDVGPPNTPPGRP